MEGKKASDWWYIFNLFNQVGSVMIPNCNLTIFKSNYQQEISKEGHWSDYVAMDTQFFRSVDWTTVDNFVNDNVFFSSTDCHQLFIMRKCNCIYFSFLSCTHHDLYPWKIVYYKFIVIWTCGDQPVFLTYFQLDHLWRMYFNCFWLSSCLKVPDS